MRKVLCLLLAVAMCLAFAGCSTKRNDSDEKAISSDKKLYRYGLETIALMQEKANSEAYLNLIFNSNKELMELVETFGSDDMDAPSAVYRLELPKTEKLLEKISPETAEYYNDLSPELKEDIDNRIAGMLCTQHLSQQGATYIACGSLLASSKEFSEMHVEQKQYFLYAFESDTAIMVTFAPSGFVSASVVSLFNKKPLDATVLEELKAMGIKLTEITTN